MHRRAEIGVAEVGEPQSRCVAGIVRPDIQRTAAPPGSRPTDTHRVVAPFPEYAQGEVLGIQAREVHDVVAGIRRDPQPVPTHRPPLQDTLEIGEGVWEVEERLHEHIEVRPPCRDPPADVGLAQRLGDGLRHSAAHRNAAGQERHPRIHLEPAVPGITLDLQNRRDPSAVLGSESAGLERRPVEHVSVEHREEAAEMERAEYRHPIQKNEVLVVRAPTDVEGRGEVRRGHHAGKHSHGADGVGLGDARHGLEVHEVQLADGGTTDFLEADALATTLRLDRNALYLDGPAVQFQLDLHGLARPHPHAPLELAVPKALGPQRISTHGHGGQAEEPQAVRLRCTHHRTGLQELDRRTEDRRSLVVPDPALDGPILCRQRLHHGGDRACHSG